MRVTDNVLIETHMHSRTINFEGAQAEPFEPYLGYRGKGKQWVPNRAFAKWVHGRPIQRITVSGYLVKQDGTPGKNRGDTSYDTPASNAWSTRWGTNAPQWLLDLFADSPHTSPAPSVPDSEGA